jgi:lysozyme
MFKTPNIKLDDLLAIIKENNIDRNDYPVVAIAIRGFYLDSMGKRGVNDRMIYDDAHAIVWPDGYATYQGNTDPNGYRKGSGTGSNKGMAMIKEGVHIYGTGLHKGTLAFRQCEPFTVIRDGNPPYEDTGWHATNWHAGGNTSTSSLGCQTNPVSVFKDEIRPQLYKLLDRYGNKKQKNDRGELVRSFPYILISEIERRKGNLLVSNRYIK